MDYYKIYTEQYQNNYSIEENLIKDELILYREKSKEYTFVHNAICKKLNEKIVTNIISINSSLNDLFNYFKKSKSEYSENNTHLSLENETLEKYNSLDKKDLPIDYSFEFFIKDLANFMSVEEIRRLLSNNLRLFDLIYKSKDFTKFEIEEYDSLLENTPNFIELHEKLYPNNQAHKSENTTIKNLNIDKNLNPNNIFNENEKALLFLAVYKILEESQVNKDSLKLDFTEYYKIISIVNLADTSSLNGDNYKNSFYYRTLTNGIEHINRDLEYQSNVLEILISKTKNAKLRTITKYLSKKSNSLMAEIVRNQKKTKK